MDRFPVPKNYGLRSVLLASFNSLKKEQIDWLTNSNTDVIKDFSKGIEIIKNFIYEFCIDIAVEIFERGHVSITYSDNPKIQKRVRNKDEKLVRTLYRDNITRELNVMLNNLKKIESMEIRKDKMSKWSGVNNSLFFTIR
jgi:hypothetical protein